MKLRYVLLFICLLQGLTDPAQALEINISAGGNKAVEALLLVEAEDVATKLNVEREMAWRIGFNGMFAVRNTAELPRSLLQEERLNWKFLRSEGIGIGLVVRISWMVDAEGRKLSLRLYGPESDNPILNRSFRLKVGADRILYNSAANRMYEALIGQAGPFGEMLYMQHRPLGIRGRELYRMRLGDSEVVQATKGLRIAMRPRSTADGSKIVMIAYGNATPEVWQLQTASGAISLALPGSAPAFGAIPDQKGGILYSHAVGNYAQLLHYKNAKSSTLVGGSSMNLGIDTTADGSKAVFSSDRFGNPHLFRLDSLGAGAKPVRLTWSGEYNASPRISPDGRWIAFARRESGSFSIFAMTLDGKQIRRLTDDGGSDEDPAWSRDNRTIYFSSDRSRSTGSGLGLYAVDLWTGTLNQVTHIKGDERMPEALREP